MQNQSSYQSEKRLYPYQQTGPGVPQQQYQQQSPIAQPVQSQPQQSKQWVKFYKSGLFGFSSAAGNFERDTKPMQEAGWQLTFASFIGKRLLFGRSVIVAIYTHA